MICSRESYSITSSKELDKLSVCVCVFAHLHIYVCVCIPDYLNFLKGAVDHSDEHVEQDDDHGNVVHAVQNVADIFDELVPVINDHGFDFRESEYSPEQCFKALLHTVGRRTAKECVSLKQDNIKQHKPNI